jgi:hypothetical protein
VQKKRQTDDALLKQARNLSQELFNALGPTGEKELFDFYTQRFNGWLSNLKSYKSKTDVGRFPGKTSIEQAILSLQRLLSNSDSVDFFKAVVDNRHDYLNLEEDYRDLHEFFSNQLHTWQQLQQALHRFEKNKPALEKDDKARKALAELHSIESNAAPYNQLHQVAALVETVESINSAILTDKRSHALSRVDEKITQLQLVKAELETETSIANIYMLQTQTADERLHDGVFELERAIQAEAERQHRLQQEQAKITAQTASQGNGVKEDRAPSPTPAAKPVIPPKPVVDVAATSVFNKLGNGVYLEAQADVDRFLSALKVELDAQIQQGKRIRLR